jgi:gamma-glutamylcysteine synthetase
MMTILIHRVKTGLRADEICFLQFTAIKIFLRGTKTKLDSDIDDVTSRLADLINKGSSEVLTADQRLFWLRKNYVAILYNVNKQIFSHLQRVEERQHASIREQFLGAQYKFVVDVLFNPILLVSDPRALPLLMNEFCIYSRNGVAKGFVYLNTKIEKQLNRKLKQLPLPALGEYSTATITEAEIHDKLGGLFQT